MLLKFDEIPDKNLSYSQFMECIKADCNIVEKSMAEKFILPEFASFKNEVKDIFEECRQNKEGKVANYIPELAR
jgi:glutaminase